MPSGKHQAAMIFWAKNTIQSMVVLKGEEGGSRVPLESIGILSGDPLLKRKLIYAAQQKQGAA